MLRPTLFLAVLVSFLSAVVSEIYGKIGGEVVLKPPQPLTSVTDIIWKHRGNLAVEWDGKRTDEYLIFKGHSYLNTSTGELTIKNLTQNHAGEYKLEINGTPLPSSITLKVISPVPTPHISLACDQEKTSCNLTCEGDIINAGPVKYTWKSNKREHKSSSNTFTITPETTADNFICELQNPVSQERSEPIADPFQKSTESSGESNPKIYTAAIVFSCLVTVVVAIGLIHRLKTGMWFYEKDSMPWELDFWKRTGNRVPSEPEHTNDSEEDATMEDGTS